MATTKSQDDALVKVLGLESAVPLVMVKFNEGKLDEALRLLAAIERVIIRAKRMEDGER